MNHKEFEAKLDEALGKMSDKAYIELIRQGSIGEIHGKKRQNAIIEEMKHCEEADGNR